MSSTYRSGMKQVEQIFNEQRKATEFESAGTWPVSGFHPHLVTYTEVLSDDKRLARRVYW